MTETLRKMIEKTGKPIYAFAKDVGIPQPMLHRFMKDGKGLTLKTAEKLADHFNLELRPRS